MPDRSHQPRPLVWIMYLFQAAAGIAFGLTEDAESLVIVVGPWAPWVTGTMLVLGAVVGTAGSVVRVNALELAAYPFLVGVWVIYATAIFARSLEGVAPLGFSFLLSAGAALLLGRCWQLWEDVVVARELASRTTSREATT